MNPTHEKQCADCFTLLKKIWCSGFEVAKLGSKKIYIYKKDPTFI